MGDFIAGCLAGFSSTLVGHPFDTIKTRLQIYPEKYSSARDCFRLVLRNEGLTALYRGMVFPLFGNLFLNGTIFWVNESVYWYLDNHEQSNFNIARLISGCSAGFVQSFLVCPLESLKCQRQHY